MQEIIKLLTPLVIAATEWFTNGTKFVGKIEKTSEIALTLAISEMKEKEPYQVSSAQEDLDDLEIELSLLQNDETLKGVDVLIKQFEEMNELKYETDEKSKKRFQELKNALETRTDPSNDYKIKRRIERLKELPEEIERANLKMAKVKKRAEAQTVKTNKTIENLTAILNELKA